jgi:prevent-host-death family protein
MQIANIHIAKAQLSLLIKRALAGEEVVIARAGEPLVKLVPVHTDPLSRQGGQIRGMIQISEDFDDSDEELEQLFYGSEP